MRAALLLALLLALPALQSGADSLLGRTDHVITAAALAAGANGAQVIGPNKISRASRAARLIFSRLCGRCVAVLKATSGSWVCSGAARRRGGGGRARGGGAAARRGRSGSRSGSRRWRRSGASGWRGGRGRERRVPGAGQQRGGPRQGAGWTRAHYHSSLPCVPL
jgi:hypothetical protein